MIKVPVKLTFPDDVLQLLETGDMSILAIPVTTPELLRAREIIGRTRDYLALSAKVMRTARQTLQDTPDAARQLVKLVDQMFDPTLAATELFEDLMLLFARAVAVRVDRHQDGGPDRKEPIQ